MLNKTVNGEMAQDSRGLALITDLKPYTTYMVKIALITKHGEGLHSDPLLNTTMEGCKRLRKSVYSIAYATVGRPRSKQRSFDLPQTRTSRLLN